MYLHNYIYTRTRSSANLLNKQSVGTIAHSVRRWPAQVGDVGSNPTVAIFSHHLSQTLHLERCTSDLSRIAPSIRTFSPLISHFHPSISTCTNHHQQQTIRSPRPNFLSYKTKKNSLTSTLQRDITIVFIKSIAQFAPLSGWRRCADRGRNFTFHL